MIDKKDIFELLVKAVDDIITNFKTDFKRAAKVTDDTGRLYAIVEKERAADTLLDLIGWYRSATEVEYLSIKGFGEFITGEIKQEKKVYCRSRKSGRL